MAAPTRVAGWSSATATNTTAQTSTTFSLVAGDVLVASVGTDASAPAAADPTVTGGSVTWTRLTTSIENTLNESNCTVWTGSVGATASATVTVNISSGFNNVMFVEQWRGVSAVGASANAHLATTGSVALTTTAANSAVVVSAIDTNAVAGTITWRTVNATVISAENTYQVAAVVSAYFGYLADAGAAGANTYGVSAPTGEGASVVAVELKGSASGTNYTASPADTVALSDSGAAVQLNVRTAADTVALSDSANIVQAQQLAPADNVALSDAATVIQSQQLAQADNVGLSDSASVVQAQQVMPADNVGLSDAVSFVQSQRLTAADTVSLSDSVTAVLNGGGTNYTANPADTVALSDAATVQQAQQLAPADNVGLTDSASVQQSQQVTAADNIGLTDTLTQAVAGVRAGADTAGLSDSVSFVQSQQLAPADSLGLSDSAAVVQAQQQAGADSVGLSDAVTVRLDRVVTVSDTLGLTDTVFQSGAARDLTLTFTALQSRFSLVARASRFVAAAVSRFSVSLQLPRLTAAALLSRFANVPLGGIMTTTIHVSKGEKQYAGGTVTEITGKDISTATYMVSLGSPDVPGTAAIPDKNAAGSANNIRTVAKLIDNTVPLGRYWVWIHVGDSPENVLIPAQEIIVA